MILPRALALLLFTAAVAGRAQTLERHPAPPQTQQQAATPESVPNTPTGRWISEHTSAGGIGTWWDFRPDGTLTMYIGAAVTAPISHTANTVVVPGSGGNRLTLDYRITGNILNLKRAGDPDTLFTRVGPALTPSDPLLGRWRPNPPATYSSDPRLAARQKAMTSGVYVFSADDTQTVRIPFVSRTGTWDATAHTLRLEGESQTFSFNRTAQRLVLGQPPDNTKTGTYIPDLLFPQ
ncbi:MAG: hypothetical protein JST61_02445 [Acidobacteria bacterium]|nr:hypothetical protein [Acidobacteriota bacterium]